MTLFSSLENGVMRIAVGGKVIDSIGIFYSPWASHNYPIIKQFLVI